MELPFVYIDPHEENGDIANVAQILGQGRRIIVNDAVSEELKRAVFDVAMECIVDVRRYYQAKEKEAQLLKKDAEVDGKLCQVERELAEKERINNGLRASIEEKKRNIQLSELAMRRSRTKTSDLLRQRKELEEECKKLNSEVEQSNALWASSLQAACSQRDRLQMLMDQSPRLAKQNSERNAVKALEMRIEELKLEYSQLEEEEDRLKKELEFQSATPLRVFVVNFAKITLRTLEMQEKLCEAKKTFQQLKAEEIERMKAGPSEYDAFDASFVSMEYGLKKAPDHGSKNEFIEPEAVPRTAEAVDDESSNGGSITTSESSNKSPSVEPPKTTEEDVIKARTNAIEIYVTQQSQSISRQADLSGSNSPEATRNEDELDRSPLMDVEVMSTNEEQNAHEVLENESMNETLDENKNVNASQEIVPEDFSDEDMGMEEVNETGSVATTENAKEADENVCRGRSMTQQNDCSTAEEAIHHGNRSFGGPVTIPSTRKAFAPEMYSGSQESRDQEKSLISHMSYQSAIETGSTAPYPEASSSKPSENVLNVATPSPCIGPSQETSAFFSNLLKGPPSPIQDAIPFNFGSAANIDEFDPTVVLNISSHSNDPGGDFLSLIESTNDKRERDRQSEGSGCAAEFSFSMFGAASDVGTSAGGFGGDFAFDFGNPSQNGEASDSTFQFNFGGNPNDESSNNKDTGFNFFGF